MHGAPLNEEHTYSGRYCLGKMPMETFMESLSLAKQKLLNQNSPAANLLIPTLLNT